MSDCSIKSQPGNIGKLADEAAGVGRMGSTWDNSVHTDSDTAAIAEARTATKGNVPPWSTDTLEAKRTTESIKDGNESVDALTKKIIDALKPRQPSGIRVQGEQK